MSKKLLMERWYETMNEEDNRIDWNEINDVVYNHQPEGYSSPIQNDYYAAQQSSSVKGNYHAYMMRDFQDDDGVNDSTPYGITSYSRDPFMGYPVKPRSTQVVQDTNACPQASHFDHDDLFFVQRMNQKSLGLPIDDDQERQDTLDSPSPVKSVKEERLTQGSNSSFERLMFINSVEDDRMIHSPSLTAVGTFDDMDSDDAEMTDVELDVFFPKDSQYYGICCKRAVYEKRLQQQQKRRREEEEEKLTEESIVMPKKRGKKRKHKDENRPLSPMPSYVMDGEILMPMTQYADQVSRQHTQRQALSTLSGNLPSGEPSTSTGIRRDLKATYKVVKKNPMMNQGKKIVVRKVVGQENLHQDEETKREEEKAMNVVNFPYTSVSSITFPEVFFSPDPVIGSFKKIPLSFTCMSALCIISSPTKAAYVGEMYEYLANSFPYFKTVDSTWRNSLRHNLSTQNHNFLKIENTCKGDKKGYAWTINPARQAFVAKRVRLNKIVRLESLVHVLGHPKVIFDLRDAGLLSSRLERLLFGSSQKEDEKENSKIVELDQDNIDE